MAGFAAVVCLDHRTGRTLEHLYSLRHTEIAVGGNFFTVPWEIPVVMRVLHRFFVAVVLFSLASTSLADETKPIVVVSLRGHQNLIDDLAYIGSTSALKEKDHEKYGQRFIKGVNRFIRKLSERDEFDILEAPGVDPQRPWGFAILTDEVNIVPVAFLPITDLDAYLEFLKKNNDDRVEETEDGLYEFNVTDTETMFIKLEGDWGFIAQGPGNLVTLPNPEEILGDLPLQYDMGIQINIQEIPEFLRDMVLDSSDGLSDIIPIDGLQSLTGMLGGDPDAALKMMLTQIDQITIGISVDAEEKIASFEVIVKPIEDSAVQRHFAALPEATTRFGMLVDQDSAIMAHVTIAEMDDRMKQLSTKAINDYHQQVMAVLEASDEVSTDREREVFGELLGSLTEIATATVDSGSVDMAMRITGDSKKLTLVAATKIADRAPVDAMVRRIAELADGDPGFETIELEVAEHDGVAIHAFKLAPSGDGNVSAGAGMMKALFGDSADIYVAVSEEALFLAIGVDGLEQLKVAMQLEEKLVPPMEAVIDLKPIIRLAMGALGDNQQMKMAVGLMGAQLINTDSHMSFSLKPSSDGMVFRGEAREGILRLIAVAFPLLQDTILDQIKSGSGALGLPSIPGF